MIWRRNLRSGGLKLVSECLRIFTAAFSSWNDSLSELVWKPLFSSGEKKDKIRDVNRWSNDFPFSKNLPFSSCFFKYEMLWAMQIPSDKTISNIVKLLRIKMRWKVSYGQTDMLNYLIQQTLVLLLFTLNQKILTYLNRKAHRYTNTVVILTQKHNKVQTFIF